MGDGPRIFFTGGCFSQDLILGKGILYVLTGRGMQGIHLLIMGPEPVTGQELLLGAEVLDGLFQVMDLPVLILDLLKGMLVITCHDLV